MSKVPKRFIHTPEEIALQILEAMKKDKQWAYSDFYHNQIFSRIGKHSPVPPKNILFKGLLLEITECEVEN